jgi:hypothetical protein
MSNPGDNNFYAVMLIDDNEIDNLDQSENDRSCQYYSAHIYAYWRAKCN